MAVLQAPHAGKAVVTANTDCVHPPQIAPGLGPPRTWNGAWIQIFVLECRMNDECLNDPSCNSTWWGPDGAGPPREGDDPLLR